MYTNSKGKIKLLNKVSEAFDILIGTEQGHPMSPELFKIYLLEMSSELDSCPDTAVPELNGVSISHLLWADDLVLLALDGLSLQRLIDTVHNYCSLWGLSINISKTAIMVFNKSGRRLKESRGFQYGDTEIPSAQTYCYLGIIFSLSGSFSRAQDELRKKGLRAYFSLKKLLDLRSLTIVSVFKLFNALILPVFAYGCQVWLMNTNFFKLMQSGKISSNTTNSLKRIAADPTERIHLKLLKWTMGVHSKTSNIACWGDSGRMPIVTQLTKQTFDYYKRLQRLHASDSNSLVRHAFAEQERLSLPWIKSMKNYIDNVGLSDSASSSAIRDSSKQIFEGLWLTAMTSSSKLCFYSSVKKSISYEPYLSLYDPKKRRAVAKIRSSSHSLNVETGRYTTTNSTVNSDQILWNKCCKTCSDSNAESLASLPFFEPIIEDERHVMATCPKYHHVRIPLASEVKSTIISWNPEYLSTIFSLPNISILASFLTKIFRIRFPNIPKKIKKKKKKEKKKG